jgi:hypothetical protein
MTAIDIDEAIRSLLTDIGDAAGVPSAPGLLRLSKSPASERRHGGRYLVVASTIVVIGLAAGAVMLRRAQDDSPATGHSTVNVAPGVGQWLDLPTAPAAMTLVPGKPFEVSPICVQIGATVAGQACLSISGAAQVAYANQSPTVIEIRTVFTTLTLDDYVTGLVHDFPDPYQDQTVTVRGHPGRLLSANTKLVAWQERPGVIGQIRIVADTANTDLIALANSLIQREWDPKVTIRA